MAGLVELERQVYHSREVHQGARAARVSWVACAPLTVRRLNVLPRVQRPPCQRSGLPPSPRRHPLLPSAAAEAAIAAQPDLLIHRVCQHFQRLFGCRSLEGILPAMNKVYAERSGARCQGPGVEQHRRGVRAC